MNIGMLDRFIRFTVGILLVTLAATNVLGEWAYIGIISLATAVFKWCPFYTLVGLQTCPLHAQVKSK